MKSNPDGSLEIGKKRAVRVLWRKTYLCIRSGDRVDCEAGASVDKIFYFRANAVDGVAFYSDVLAPAMVGK